MIQISVDENCSGCGLCIVNCHYLEENSEGNAQPVEGIAIQDKDMEKVNKVIAECPEHALKIVEMRSTNKKGAAGVADIIVAMKNQYNSFAVKRVSNSDVKFNSKNAYILVPFSSRDNRKEYFTSESSAKSAAKDEFNRLCYSEAAYRPIIKKVFVEYKVNVLKPYYTCTDTEDSIYYAYNHRIRKLLSDAYAEIGDVLEGINKVPESWKEFSIYLSDKDWVCEPLKNFDGRSTSSGIMSDFKDRGEYTSLNWYVDRMNFDYDETYAGAGAFGKSKYKNMWYFTGFNAAAEEFIKDLKGSIDSMSRDIEDEAVYCVNGALETFEKKIKEALNIKISELEKYLK